MAVFLKLPSSKCSCEVAKIGVGRRLSLFLPWMSDSQRPRWLALLQPLTPGRPPRFCCHPVHHQSRNWLAADIGRSFFIRCGGGLESYHTAICGRSQHHFSRCGISLIPGENKAGVCHFEGAMKPNMMILMLKRGFIPAVLIETIERCCRI